MGRGEDFAAVERQLFSAHMNFIPLGAVVLRRRGRFVQHGSVVVVAPTFIPLQVDFERVDEVPGVDDDVIGPLQIDFRLEGGKRRDDVETRVDGEAVLEAAQSHARAPGLGHVVQFVGGGDAGAFGTRPQTGQGRHREEAASGAVVAVVVQLRAVDDELIGVGAPLAEGDVQVGRGAVVAE